MAEGRRRDRGGILGLLEAITSDVSAPRIEADLIRSGMRLRWFLDPDDTDHNWRDLLVFLKYAPEGSAFYSHSAGEAAVWGLGEQLLATVVDQVNVLLWQKTKDGYKNRNRPKPIPRPGVEDKKSAGKKLGGKTKMNAGKLAGLLGMKF